MTGRVTDAELVHWSTLLAELDTLRAVVATGTFAPCSGTPGWQERWALSEAEVDFNDWSRAAVPRLIAEVIELRRELGKDV